MNSALLNHFFAKKLEKNADFRPRVRTQIHPTHLTCFWLFPVTNWACSAFPRHLTLKTQCIALSIRRGLTFSATHRPRWRRENECVDKLPIITPSFSAKIPWVCGSQNTSSNFKIPDKNKSFDISKLPRAPHSPHACRLSTPLQHRLNLLQSIPFFC